MIDTGTNFLLILCLVIFALYPKKENGETNGIFIKAVLLNSQSSTLYHQSGPDTLRAQQTLTQETRNSISRRDENGMMALPKTLTLITITILSNHFRLVESMVESDFIGFPSLDQQREWLVQELNGAHL